MHKSSHETTGRDFKPKGNKGTLGIGRQKKGFLQGGRGPAEGMQRKGTDSSGGRGHTVQGQARKKSRHLLFLC